jgi:hypothetical protein
MASMISFIFAITKITMVLIWAAMAYIAYKIVRWIGAKLTHKGNDK